MSTGPYDPTGGGIQLAWLLFDDQEFGAAENAASRAIGLVTREDDERLVCQLHRVLGHIYRFKRNKWKAIHHLETALQIAPLLAWQNELFWIHCSLVEFFRDGGELESANAHVEQLKLYAVGGLTCAQDI
jgi:hypothetical protein